MFNFEPKGIKVSIKNFKQFFRYFQRVNLFILFILYLKLKFKNKISSEIIVIEHLKPNRSVRMSTFRAIYIIINIKSIVTVKNMINII